MKLIEEILFFFPICPPEFSLAQGEDEKNCNRAALAQSSQLIIFLESSFKY